MNFVMSRLWHLLFYCDFYFDLMTRRLIYEAYRISNWILKSELDLKKRWPDLKKNYSILILTYLFLNYLEKCSWRQSTCWLSQRWLFFIHYFTRWRQGLLGYRILSFNETCNWTSKSSKTYSVVISVLNNQVSYQIIE